MAKLENFPGEILLVEDEAVSRIELARALRRKGFQVRQARTSHEAVQQAASSHPTVVLMDILLGDKEPDGIDAACEIQKAHPFISVIFISAYADDPLYRDKVQEKQLRVSAWLEKPINPSKLIDTLSFEMKKALIQQNLANAKALRVDSETSLRRASARDRKITQPIIQGLLSEVDESLEKPSDVENLADLKNPVKKPTQGQLSFEKRFGGQPPLADIFDISHELKNIFNQLALTLRNIQESMPLLGETKATRERISSALRGVDRGAELVKMMFHAARASEVDAPRVTIDLYGICRRAVEDLEPMTVANEVNCILQCDSEREAGEASKGRLIGYPDKILIAVKNTLQNAIEASPRLSQVRVEVSIGLDAAMIRISDCGQGISHSLQKKIFEPHFSTKTLEGSGLGLSIAKDIIERLHFGLIGVTSRKSGSCFSITLPFQR